jgi:hypothetical protein
VIERDAMMGARSDRFNGNPPLKVGGDLVDAERDIAPDRDP